MIKVEVQEKEQKCNMPLFKNSLGNIFFVVQVSSGGYLFCHFDPVFISCHHMNRLDDKELLGKDDIFRRAKEEGLTPFYGKVVVTVDI